MMTDTLLEREAPAAARAATAAIWARWRRYAWH